MTTPLVINTKDGICWTRRTVTASGIALYAPQDVRTCPRFVMATLSELAEHGIVGSADVLPVAVGPEPQEDPVARCRRLDLLELMDDRAASMVSPLLAAVLDEAERLRARVTELEALTTQATEFRLWEPGYGLYVRRAPGATGFGVLEARRTDEGRRCWTTSGWQYSAVLSDTELFCWPDAQTAVTEAQRVMPGATVREASNGGDAR